jgi:hypothetical protein
MNYESKRIAFYVRRAFFVKSSTFTQKRGKKEQTMELTKLFHSVLLSIVCVLKQTTLRPTI